MRILIIGGTRFIGPFVARRLADLGHSVTVFHRGTTPGDLPSEVQHLHCPDLDFGTRRELAKYLPALRDLAPEVVLDMIPMTETAVHATQDALRGVARRLVLISSMDVYRAYGVLIGKETGELDPLPINEESPLRSQLYPYRGEQPRSADDPRRWMDDYDKIPLEHLALQDRDLPGTVLRLPMVYGPGDAQHRLFEYLKRMDDRRPFILLDEALANWRWTRGYVEDIAAGIALAVTNPRAAGRVYNVGEAQAAPMAEWVRAIARSAGWTGEVQVLPGKVLPAFLRADMDARQDLAVDTSRIRSELGYAETVMPQEALARTVAWERANPPAQVDPAQFDYAAEDAAWQAWGKM